MTTEQTQAPTTAFYEFAEFRLDVHRMELTRAGEAVPLTPRVCETLLVLVQGGGRLMTKDELIKAVWHDTVVGDCNLTQTVFMIRKALGDTCSEQRFIMTVPGRGYRFVAEVKAVPANGHPASYAPVAAAAPAMATVADNAPGRRGWPISVGIALLVIASLAVVYFSLSRSRARTTPSNGKLMVAVLPFGNLTGNNSEDYLSDGLTEEMISQLGDLDPQHLGVIARTSVMHYKNSGTPLEQIGRELGVQYVLEGSVRHDSDRVRVSAQLIQMKDQTHLWAHQYDRELRSLLSLQGEIAQEVAREIQLTLVEKLKNGTPRAAPSTPSYEAYDLYLKGLYFWNKRTVASLWEAVHYFEQATSADPNYARAYAGLADSYALLGGYSAVPQAEFMSKARAAALQALEIDESLPEAHTALALIVQNFEWDWQTAEKEYRRAIELNPNYATAHHWYAEHLAFLGRFDEALRESERARELDPLSLIIASDRGVILYYARQYDRSIEQFHIVHEMDPHFPRADMVRYAYVAKGMFADAVANINEQRRNYGDGVWSWSELVLIYARTGKPALAEQALAELERMDQQQPVDPGVFVTPYIGMNNKDRAFAYLEKAYQQHSNVMTTLKVDPVYDPLRDDPRFQVLLKRVGLGS